MLPPIDTVRSPTLAPLPVQQPAASTQTVAKFNDVLNKNTPPSVATPAATDNPFASLTSAVDKALILLWSAAATNTDPAQTQTNQVIKSATEAQLWSDEATRRQGIAQQAQKDAEAAKTQYGENSPQYLAALAKEREADASVWQANANAGQAQAQLNVYAADPSYKSAIQSAKQIIDAGLNSQGLQWQTPEPQGSLSDAQARLTQSGQIVLQANQAVSEYQQADGAFSQLPSNYDPQAPYQQLPPMATSTNYSGPSWDTLEAQNKLTYDQRQSVYWGGVQHMANGNKLLADVTVGTLQQQLGLLTPGSKEYTQTQTALTAAQGDQTTAGTNQQVTQTYYNLAAANVNLDQVQLQYQGITRQALAAAYQTNSYWFDPNGFTNANDDVSGKLKGVTVKIGSDGQLYAEFTYEHRNMEIQLTFAQGKVPSHLPDSWKSVSAAWASFNAPMSSAKLCFANDNAMAQAKYEQVAAQQAVNDLQKSDAQQLVTQLTKTYQDTVAKYGNGITPVSYSPSSSGQQPGAPSGANVPPEVSTAWSNLQSAKQLYAGLQANGDWLGFLMTQDLSNYSNQDEQENLRKKFFVNDTTEQQREFNPLMQAYGKPILLQQTPGSQLTAWDTPVKLQNGVGVALNIQPDNQTAASSADMSQPWYSGQSLDAIGAVTDKIQKLAGKDGKVQVIPTFFAMDQGGLAQSALFMVTDAGGHTRIVDSTGRDYKDIKDFQQNNQLQSSGALYLPKNLLSPQGAQNYQLVANVTGQAADASYNSQGDISIQSLHIDGPSKGWQTADGAVGVVTSIATVLSFTPLAPVAAPVAIAGGSYLGVRAGMQLWDMKEHGQSWLSKEGMLDLAMVATSALPVAAGSVRLAGLLRSGMEFAPGLRTSFGAFYARDPLAGPFPASYAADAHLLMADGGPLFNTAKGLDITAAAIGAPLMAVTSYDTAVHWDEMSGFNRFSNALGFASGVYATGMGARGRMNVPTASENSYPRLFPADNNQPIQWQAQPQIQHQQGPISNPDAGINLLTVGGGHVFRPPTEGEVFLNIDSSTRPDILSDIRQTSIPNGQVSSVYFENFPYDVLTETPPAALSETYRVLKPGGTVRIQIGSLGILNPIARGTIIQHMQDLGFANVRAFVTTDDATGTRTWQFRGTKPTGGTSAIDLETQLPTQQEQGQTSGGSRRPLTYIQVRDPVSGDVIQAVVFRNVQPLVNRVGGDSGIVDSSHIYDPTKPLSQQSPKFALVADETGSTYLLPFIAGAAPRPIERFTQGSKKAGQVVAKPFVTGTKATGQGLVWFGQNVLKPTGKGIAVPFVAIGRGGGWVGNNVIKPGWRKGALIIAVASPAAELSDLPFQSPQGVADYGNLNFFGRGPVLIVSAFAAARKKLNPLTKTGLVLRTSAGASFWMNAANNYWKVTEGLSNMPVHPSLVHNVLPLVSQGFFALGQTVLGARSLTGARQAAKIRPYITGAKVYLTDASGAPITNWRGKQKYTMKWTGNDLTVQAGDSWKSIAKQTGVPLDMLPVIQPGDTLKIYEKYVVKPGENLQSIAANFGVSDPRSITLASGLLPSQITPGRTIVVPHDITVQANQTVKSLAKKYGDTAPDIRRRNNLGTVTADQTIKVPVYLWESGSKTSRWLQIAGAYSMTAASSALFFVDLPKWGLGSRMLFAPADIAIATGTSGTATLTLMRNKIAVWKGQPGFKGQIARALSNPWTLATFQMMSATALGWKGLGHEWAQHNPGDLLPLEIQKKDTP